MQNFRQKRVLDSIPIDTKISFIASEIKRNAPLSYWQLDELTQINFGNENDKKAFSHRSMETIKHSDTSPTETRFQFEINQSDQIQVYAFVDQRKIEITPDIEYGCLTFNNLIDKYYTILKNRKDMLQPKSYQPQSQIPTTEGDHSQLNDLKKFFINLSKKYQLGNSLSTQQILTSQDYNCSITRDDNNKIIIEFINSTERLNQQHYKIVISDNDQLAFYSNVGTVVANKFYQVDHTPTLISLLDKIKKTIDDSAKRGEVVTGSLMDRHKLRKTDHSKVSSPAINTDPESNLEAVVSGGFGSRRQFFAERSASAGFTPLPRPAHLPSLNRSKKNSSLIEKSSPDQHSTPSAKQPDSATSAQLEISSPKDRQLPSLATVKVSFELQDGDSLAPGRSEPSVHQPTSPRQDAIGDNEQLSSRSLILETLHRDQSEDIQPLPSAQENSGVDIQPLALPQENSGVDIQPSRSVVKDGNSNPDNQLPIKDSNLMSASASITINDREVIRDFPNNTQPQRSRASCFVRIGKCNVM